jgi:hypothetical protein
MKVREALSGLLVLAAMNGFACEIPTVVEIPETKDVRGRTRAVQAETGDYIRAMVEYTECIKAEIEAGGGDVSPPLFQSLLVQRNNAAVAEVKVIMALFEARIGPIEDAEVANAVRAADDLRRTGASPPIQSRAP